MTNDLPLAAASERLRRKPGRPKKPPSTPAVVAATSAIGRDGRGGTQDAVAYEASGPLPTRLLDLEATAAYLGLSPWTVRYLESAGTLRRVRIPLPPTKDRPSGELRKLLFDRSDLDRLVEEWKQAEP